MDTHEQIVSAYETYLKENEAFTVKGSKAAGTRARNALLEIGKLTKIRRQEILEESKRKE